MIAILTDSKEYKRVKQWPEPIMVFCCPGLDINAALMKLKNSVVSAQKPDWYKLKQWLPRPKIQNK